MPLFYHVFIFGGTLGGIALGLQNALFVILTRTPAKSIAFIHDRMPVIIPKEKVGDWMPAQISFDELMKETVENVA